MKKICSVLLLFVLLMSTSVVSFANGNNEITFEQTLGYAFAHPL